MSKILIGIPTLNGPGRLEDCLNSIYKTHDFHRNDVTILVVDDGSTSDNIQENLRICKRRDIQLLLHGARNGVAAAWNTLVNYRNDFEYCILINDDVLVTHHWIDTVVFTLKHNSNIGVVGLNAYEGENSLLPVSNFPTYIESSILIGSKFSSLLSARGFAFGFRMQDFKAIGGFDQRFFCFFEEIDFNLNMMKLLNKRNCMLSFPILKHVHGATTFSELPSHSDIFIESKNKFEEKWQVKWEKLRELFNSDAIPAIDKNNLVEWNSNIGIWG